MNREIDCIFNQLIEIYKQLKSNIIPSLKEWLLYSNFESYTKQFLIQLEKRNLEESFNWNNFLSILNDYCGDGLRFLFNENCLFV